MDDTEYSMINSKLDFSFFYFIFFMWANIEYNEGQFTKMFEQMLDNLIEDIGASSTFNICRQDPMFYRIYEKKCEEVGLQNFWWILKESIQPRPLDFPYFYRGNWLPST